MKMYPRSGEKRRFDDIDVDDEEAIGTLCRMSGGHPASPGCTIETEKRMRREIANSNERRRMQSINAGFNSLRKLLPCSEGEKLSKAAILQQTADYIVQLEQERKELISQNNQLKKVLHQQESTDGSSSDGEGPLSDLLSTIQDLQQNPNTCKLPNTEFHKLNNNSTSKNNNNTKTNAQSGYSSRVDFTSQQHHQVDSKVTPLRGVPEANVHVKSIKCVDSEDKLILTADSGDYHHVALSYVTHLSGDAGGDRRRRHAEDKIKTVVRSHAMIKSEYCEDPIKSEPTEYSTVQFGLEEQVCKVTASSGQQCSGTVVYSSGGPRCYTINTSSSPHHQPHLLQQHHPNTTIVTILPPTPPHPNSMPSVPVSLPATFTKAGKTSVLEVVSGSSPPQGNNRRLVEACVESGHCIITSSPRVEVEPASRIPTPDEVEYSAGESPPHQHLHHDSESYISGNTIITTSNAKSNNGQSCQNSLDTICEAIRHLEGDMFITGVDGPSQMNRIEEEIITEETFPVQDNTAGSILDTDPAYLQRSRVSTLVRHSKEAVYEICSESAVEQRLQFQPTTTFYSIEDHHLISSEPQEVPLELTTSHRIERVDSPPHHTSASSNQARVYPDMSSLLQASRPDVIVVRQA